MFLLSIIPSEPDCRYLCVIGYLCLHHSANLVVIKHSQRGRMQMLRVRSRFESFRVGNERVIHTSVTSCHASQIDCKYMPTSTAAKPSSFSRTKGGRFNDDPSSECLEGNRRVHQGTCVDQRDQAGRHRLFLFSMYGTFFETCRRFSGTLDSRVQY